jgi:deazaflavin-dependent oxidoreductase (nitroreductase family)
MTEISFEVFKMTTTLGSTLMKSYRSLHVFLYHISRGKVGGSINGSPLLLLTVIGRKSGQAHTIPLAYIQHDGEYLISASAAGADKNPVWFLNLTNQPEARIEVKGKVYHVKVTVTAGAERNRLYALFKAQGRNFAEYERKTARRIPVIRLQPIATA